MTDKARMHFLNESRKLFASGSRLWFNLSLDDFGFERLAFV